MAADITFRHRHGRDRQLPCRACRGDRIGNGVRVFLALAQIIQRQQALIATRYMAVRKLRASLPPRVTIIRSGHARYAISARVPASNPLGFT